MKRIGIMGGTFNPIHNGHLAIAERAREQFLLEKVLFIPSGVPYMKDLQDVLPVSVRCEMTAAAIAGKTYFELSDIEAADAKRGKNTYTCETLQKLRRMDPDAEYYFILGADSLRDIENWKQPELIFQNCTILAAVRGEYGSSKASSKEWLTGQISYLLEKFDVSIEILDIPDISISSTQIRRLSVAGESIHGLVPETVETYILRNHLYQSS